MAGLNTSFVDCSWDVVDVITEDLGLGRQAIANTVRLLCEDNTVPFIARYRKEQTHNMTVDQIRDVKDHYEQLESVHNKSISVIKIVEKAGKMTRELKSALKAVKNMKEIEFLYAPYKAGSKRTLAERAREAGLEQLATTALRCPHDAWPQAAVKPGKEGVSTLADVEKGLQHIIADVIAKDKDTLDKIRELFQRSHTTIETAKSRVTTKKEKENDTNHKEDEKIHKFELYFKFTLPVKYMKPHQVLAINRGETLKILTVKVNIPDHVKNNFTNFCERKWSATSRSHLQKLFHTSVEDAYVRLLAPLMVRHCRADLTKRAAKASVEVFASNLKRLLLTPPVRGKVVLGLDPGFRNGCKYAVTSISGTILDTGVLYLHGGTGGAFREEDRLVQIVNSYRCETIAIGNGTACRETETVLSHLLKKSAFHSSNVKYCSTLAIEIPTLPGLLCILDNYTLRLQVSITSESGASIYSASDLAQKELPDLDVTLRGAVSIARRLQDPLAELVKIEPKHIGVGMYQHDIAESTLQSALDGVVEEAVSFVGVDVNVGSESLLRRVAGLNATRAKKIIEWRETNGPFVCRSQLNAIKGFGPKTYEQCAGFIRVVPETRGETQEAATSEDLPAVGRKRKAASSASGKAAKRSKKDMAKGTPDKLDMTCIHPESYAIADRLITLASADKEYIGQSTFTAQIKGFAKQKALKDLATDLGTGEPTLQLIIDGLSQPLGHDIREEFEKPLFKQGLTSMADLVVGTVLTGRVTNNTHFGAFVDIGVGRDALLHNSGVDRRLLHGRAGLELGDRVEVVVNNVDRNRGRIGLRLNKLF